MEYLTYDELKNKFNELSIRYEMLNIAQSLPSMEEVIKGILNYLGPYFGFESLSIHLVNEKTQKVVSTHLYSMEEAGEAEPISNDILIKMVSQEGCNSLTYEERNGEILYKIVSHVRSETGLIGVLIGKRSKDFVKDEILLFEIASKQFASIIKNISYEERYRLVIENALDGIIVTDDEDCIVYINERLASLLGYPRKELIGKDFKQFIDGEGRNIFKNQTSIKPEEMEVSSCYELNIIQKNGELINVEISSTRMKDPDGSFSTVAFLKDVTEKKKLEVQLLRAERLRAVAEMANGVAHDFNNALSIILGNIQLLRLNVHDSNILETLRVIEKVAKDSAQTVRRLHDFMKNQSRKDLKSLDVNSIVKDAILITQPKWKNDAQGKGIRIDVIYNLEEISPVMGNSSELREVITNMIFNSIEAMPNGGKIEIKTFQKQDKIYIQIKDTGIGMDEEVKKRIFEPFFTTKPFTNSGLGLSMSYGIIRSFGGNIEVESSLGKGTIFTIILPVGEKEVSIENPCITERIDRKARILIIEDEELIRDVLYKGLSNAQHQVVVAKDGYEGIELFKKMEFDIVLTDLGMPNMSGWKVCKIIKEIRPQTPVGIITGWKVEPDEISNKEKGPDFILSKPFDFNEILNQVNKSLMTILKHPA